MSSKRASRKRIRAHANPLSDDIIAPPTPSHVDWHVHFPSFIPPLSAYNPTFNPAVLPPGGKAVTIADVGCGFGGLLVALSGVFPEELMLGLEIRDKVVEIDVERIGKLREEEREKRKKEEKNEANSSSTSSETSPVLYDNISVVRTNIMKYAPNYFRQGQLSRMFVLFPDPHFKRSNFRRRVISPSFLALYAYCLRIGGLLYTITDVLQLHEWMVLHLDAHPLFERVSHTEEVEDGGQGKHLACVEAMTNGTEEGKKVSRLSGNKYPAVYRRVDVGQKKTNGSTSSASVAESTNAKENATAIGFGSIRNSGSSMLQTGAAAGTAPANQ